METYWDAFTKRYKDQLQIVPLLQILQAFWYYSSQNNTDESDKLMNYDK